MTRFAISHVSCVAPWVPPLPPAPHSRLSFHAASGPRLPAERSEGSDRGGRLRGSSAQSHPAWLNSDGRAVQIGFPQGGQRAEPALGCDQGHSVQQPLRSQQVSRN